VYYALLKKRQSLELRDAYAKIVFAENEDERHTARMHYLQQKRLDDDF
jgi:phosphotransacetylase